MKIFTMFKAMLVACLFCMGSSAWAETIEITCLDVTAASYSTSENTFTKTANFGYVNLMTNNANGTPTGWAKGQVIQCKSSGTIYNKAAISKITNIRVYVVVNTNAFTIKTGANAKPTDNSVSRPTTPTGTEQITYTSYANSKTQTGQKTNANYYDFDLSETKPDYFILTNGSSALYIHKIVITYGDSGNDDDTPSGVSTLTPASTSGYIFYESFNDCDKSGGNDGTWNNIATTGNIANDNDGWTYVKGNAASSCARFGTGSAKGSATTPALGYVGDAYLTFYAAAWDGSDEKTTINLSISGGGTLSETSIDLAKGAWSLYTVKATGLTASSQIVFAAPNDNKNRFLLDEVALIPAKFSISSVGYGTFYSEFAYVMPEGVEGYIMTADGEGVAAVKTFEANDIVPAKTALLVKGNGEFDVEFTNESATISTDGNLLKGFSAYNETVGEGVHYKLGVGSNGLGWYYGGASNTTGAPFNIEANKAYLVVPSSNSPRFISIDTETAIEGVKVNEDKTVYDLSGRRVNNAAKGLYINNGKKVIR